MGIVVTISGKSDRKRTTCRVEMSGEDEAMIMPAMDDISQKLGAWLCPKCGGNLHLEQVDELKAGRSVCCPFCGVTMGR
jgi:rubrerythrin